MDPKEHVPLTQTSSPLDLHDYYNSFTVNVCQSALHLPVISVCRVSLLFTCQIWRPSIIFIPYNTILLLRVYKTKSWSCGFGLVFWDHINMALDWVSLLNVVGLSLSTLSLDLGLIWSKDTDRNLFPTKGTKGDYYLNH